MVERRRERRAWEERRNTLMFNYTQFSYYGKPVSIMFEGHRVANIVASCVKSSVFNICVASLSVCECLRILPLLLLYIAVKSAGPSLKYWRPTSEHNTVTLDFFFISY